MNSAHGTPAFRGKYAFLSNFYKCEIVAGGRVWPSSEHLYQALKFTHPDMQEQIRLHPAKGLKAFVNSRRKQWRPDWDEAKVELMKELVWQKFYQNPHLAQMLVDTGDEYIEETNSWHDNYWGVCMCDKCQTRPGSPHNMLGQILMTVRTRLQLDDTWPREK